MVTLTNVGANYDTIAAAKGLGLAIVNFTGVTQVRLVIRVNKVGTGTQSWQLWNQTDGSELGVIEDSGSTGDKQLEATFDVALTGEKVIRIRAKSTVAADDPVFYGAGVLFK